MFLWYTDISCPDVIKHFSSSTQLRKKFILLINVNIPTIVGILAFTSMINTASEILKAKAYSFNGILVYKQLKFHAQLS